MIDLEFQSIDHAYSAGYHDGRRAAELDDEEFIRLAAREAADALLAHEKRRGFIGKIIEAGETLAERERRGIR